MLSRGVGATARRSAVKAAKQNAARAGYASVRRACSSSRARLNGRCQAASKIGDTKVAMSNFEPQSYINYQRIEDNLAVVRKRSVWPREPAEICSLISLSGSTDP